MAKITVTESIERLNEFYNSRLRALDVTEPYVWRLHLSADEFTQLQADLKNCADKSKSLPIELLQNRSIATALLVYLAEWYHREYNPATGTRKCVVATDAATLKLAWEIAGFPIDCFVYRTAGGSYLWKYSTYVLGGLGINHELGRNDNGRFLKALCRIYHGEDDNLPNIDDASRAIAFKESIAQGHSLYLFIKEILSGNYKYSETKTDSLIKAIVGAYDEVIRAKFRSEWIIQPEPDTGSMTRKLRLWLNPEEVGGQQHEYLSFRHVKLWGINDPVNIKWLYVGIRWLHGKSLIKDVDKQHPLISFVNSGSDNGFIAWRIERSVIVMDVPASDFNRYEIIAFDTEGNEWLAQREEFAHWMQLWKLDESVSWSTIRKDQKQTAVIYDSRCFADIDPDLLLAFRNGSHRSITQWRWNYIPAQIAITDEFSKVHLLYNRMGYDQIFTRLYRNTIKYHDGNKISILVEDDDYGEIEEKYPVVFGPADVLISHFDTTNADEDSTTITIAENIEYKRNGKYVPWDKTSSPSYGLISVRSIVKGEALLLRTIYLPEPIVRDLDTNTILYKDIDDNQCIYHDEIHRDKKPLSSTVAIRIGDATVPVYRPVKLKEIYLDDIIISYMDGDSIVRIPYILKDRLRVSCFSEHGYSTYSCNALSSIYPHIGTQNMATRAAWESGEQWAASILDANAPEWLSVCIGDKPDSDKYGLSFLRWNVLNNDAPQSVEYDTQISKGDVLFQDMSTVTEHLTDIAPRSLPVPPFMRAKVNVLNCFLIAEKYNIYFDAFPILSNIAHNGRVLDKIVKPLIELRNGMLTQKDIIALKRLIDEYQLELDDFDINLITT